jgi:hypothetical protein
VWVVVAHLQDNWKMAGVKDEIDRADVGDTSSPLFREGGDFSVHIGMLEF